MPKFICSYAYDTPEYADFTVEAKNEKAALRLIKKALRENRFRNVIGEPCLDNQTAHRVFVSGKAHKDEWRPNMELLIKQANDAVA